MTGPAPSSSAGRPRTRSVRQARKSQGRLQSALQPCPGTAVERAGRALYTGQLDVRSLFPDPPCAVGLAECWRYSRGKWVQLAGPRSFVWRYRLESSDHFDKRFGQDGDPTNDHTLGLGPNPQATPRSWPFLPSNSSQTLLPTEDPLNMLPTDSRFDTGDQAQPIPPPPVDDLALLGSVWLPPCKFDEGCSVLGPSLKEEDDSGGLIPDIVQPPRDPRPRILVPGLDRSTYCEISR